MKKFLRLLCLYAVLMAANSAPAFYDAVLGRFATRDPIGEYGGNNLYRFVDNNPINNVDPLGLATYLGGSRNGYGHVWAAVDIPGEGVLKYNYGAANYTGPAGGPFGSVGDFVRNLDTAGKASLTLYPDIKTAAGPDEYYQFDESGAADKAVYDRMSLDYYAPLRYGEISHNCGDAALAVTGFQNVGSKDVRPQSFLNDIRKFHNNWTPNR